VKGSNVGGHLTFTITEGVVNNGTIRMESADGGYASNLSVTNGPITNNGTIRTAVGSGGERNISGNLDNHGTLDVSASVAYSGTLTTDGTVQMAAGQTLSLSGGQVLTQQGGAISGLGLLLLGGSTFNFSGGTITGQSPLLVNSNLNLGTSP